jgi:hypothetical protein
MLRKRDIKFTQNTLTVFGGASLDFVASDEAAAAVVREVQIVK